LYSKGKDTSQDSRDKETSAERIQREKKRRNLEKRKIQVRAKFSAPVQTGTGAHPASYTVGIGFVSQG
jgi:hypothetical protein